MVKMSEHKLSREEEIRIFEDRCRCESRQPETEEEKRRAEENQREFKEFYRKKHENIIDN